MSDYTKMDVDELVHKHQLHFGCGDSSCQECGESVVAELARRAREAEAYRRNWQIELEMVHRLRHKLDAIKKECDYDY